MEIQELCYMEIFINYYQFHPPDERIKLLPENLFISEEKIVALDIGCNAGDLTQRLYQYLSITNKECTILGIDIDPMLIQRANELTNQNIEYKCIDFMNKSKRDTVLNEFLAHYNVTKFTVVFCFSITMWIHLNWGDDGLKLFLKEISLNKFIIIEPQPWKCYKTAVKRLKLANTEFPHFSNLTIRENIEEFIENYLINECRLKKVYESKRTKWGRKLLIFSN